MRHFLNILQNEVSQGEDPALLFKGKVWLEGQSPDTASDFSDVDFSLADETFLVACPSPWLGQVIPLNYV